MQYHTGKERGAEGKEEICESVCRAFFLELRLWSTDLPSTERGAIDLQTAQA